MTNVAICCKDKILTKITALCKDKVPDNGGYMM